MSASEAAPSASISRPDRGAPASDRQRRRKRTGARSEKPERHNISWLFELCMFGLLTLTLLGPYMTFTSDAASGEGSIVRQVGYGLCAIGALAASRIDLDLRRVLVIPWPLALALGWCWLSMFWAIAPEIALRRVFLTTLVIWTTFLLITQMGYPWAVSRLRIALAILLAVNFVTVYLYPQIGIHQVDVTGDEGLLGDWRGIMAHKNEAGLVCAITILLMVFDAAAVATAVRLLVIAGAGVFLFYSSSRTSMAVCAATLVLGWLFSAYKYRYRPFAFGVLIVLIGAGAIVQNIYSDPFLRVLNDPSAFTGRTQIWNALLNYSKDHPLLGSGYGSFWDVGFASPIYQYAEDWVREVVHAHNGYLNVLIQIGAIGLGLVLFAVLVVPISRLLNSRNLQGQTGALLMAALVFCLGHNMTESSLFNRDSIGQVFLMMTLAMIVVADRRRGKIAQSSSDLLSWASDAAARTASSSGASRRKRRTEHAASSSSGSSS